MIAIGIDPGTVKTGYGIVRKDGGRFVRLGSGVIRTDDKQTLEFRLLTIFQELDTVLTTFAPDEAAVEDLFFAKNANSALKLGHARGVILLSLTRRDIPVSSYPPALVKRSIVGAGRAAKEQVQRVVQAILRLDYQPAEDEADALAVAVTHLNAAGFKKAQEIRSPK